MIENLLSLIRENAGDTIVNNPDIPNERNEEAVEAAGSSLVSGLQGMLAQGGTKEVLAMFTQENIDQQNPVVQNLSGNMVETMMQKFGLDRGKAGTLVGSLLPMILSKLVRRTKDPSDNGFSLDSIFGQLSGGRTSGMNLEGMLGKLAGGGLDKDGDGDVDLQDLTAMFRGGSSSAGSSGTPSSGNALDALKGIFGK